MLAGSCSTSYRWVSHGFLLHGFCSRKQLLNCKSARVVQECVQVCVWGNRPRHSLRLAPQGGLEPGFWNCGSLCREPLPPPLPPPRLQPARGVRRAAAAAQGQPGPQPAAAGLRAAVWVRAPHQPCGTVGAPACLRARAPALTSQQPHWQLTRRPPSLLPLPPLSPPCLSSSQLLQPSSQFALALAWPALPPRRAVSDAAARERTAVLPVYVMALQVGRGNLCHWGILGSANELVRDKSTGRRPYLCRALCFQSGTYNPRLWLWDRCSASPLCCPTTGQRGGPLRTC